ncbi:MAG: hypothetical protein ACK559_39410, partial [bacterium]
MRPRPTEVVRNAVFVVKVTKKFISLTNVDNNRATYLEAGLLEFGDGLLDDLRVHVLLVLPHKVIKVGYT